MKAILTKRLPATNAKPSRIKAYDSDGNQVTLSVHEFPIDECERDEDKHRLVASALVSKMGWWDYRGGYKYHIQGGRTKEGYAWVLV